MLRNGFAVLTLLNAFVIVLCRFDINLDSKHVLKPKIYAVWRNATVPFYVNPEHFDHEQTLAILTALSMFAFKTCLKFKPVMARPSSLDEVLHFVNAEGTRRCEVDPRGHSVFSTHIVKLGYECLKSPQIDMIIMKALGFPFEHNRSTRDLYIDVLQENIESGAIELFTKEDTLPLELRFLPYDVNSVMHFGNREYSKNGHRTIIFKDHNVQQKRVGLTENDLKKIEIVYGPECRARDRQEKLELCQSYPGVARRKREADDSSLYVGENSTLKPKERKKRDTDEVTKSLRVNPNITPPPDNRTDDITKTLKDLGIDQAVQKIVEHVYKVSSLALRNAREKYCNNSNTETPIAGDIKVTKNSSDILGIIEVVASFAKGMVDNAMKNLTKFCEVSEGIEAYQRYSCSSSDSRCRVKYRSTKSGPVHYSTKHRPIIPQPTKHRGAEKFVNYGREGSVTEKDGNEPTIPTIRRKREVKTTTARPPSKLDETNTPKASEISKVTDENVQRNESQIETYVTDDKKKKVNLEKEEKGKHNKEEATKTELKDNRDKAVKTIVDKENKETAIKKTQAKDRKEEMVKAQVKSKKKEAMKSNKAEDKKFKASKSNKGHLKKGTVSPGLTKSNDRRLYRGKNHSKHSAENSEVYDGLESIAIEEHQHKIKEKKTSQRKNRQDKRTPILVRDKNRYEESVSSQSSEDKQRNIKIKGKFHKFDEKEAVKEEESSKEDVKRPPKKQYKKEKKSSSTSLLPRTVMLSKQNEDFYNDRRWPDGEVIYMIQEDTTYDLDDMRRRLAEVNNILRKKTCVKLIEIKPDDAENYENYLLLDNSPDYVTGLVGGKQNFGCIELFRGGQHRQHAAMMVMSMLGFYFEVSRHDRDKHIRVHMRHVRPDKLHHFELVRSDATLPLPYDYYSATHPAWQFWRRIGKTGISTVATLKEKDPDGKLMKLLGQNEKLLSDTDIVKINSVYGTHCFKKN